MDTITRYGLTGPGKAVSDGERHYCLDCNQIMLLDTHGRCSCCHSDAVVTTETIRRLER